MKIQQDWNTFRWSRITLLSDPAAKVLRMNVHVFSDSTLCVGVSNPDRPTTGQQNWMKYGTNTILSKNTIWQTEKCNSFGTYCQALPLMTLRIIFRDIWTGKIQNFLMRERIKFISMFSDMERTKRSSTETCLRNAKEVAAFAATFKPGHSERDVGGTQIPTNLRENEIMSHCRWLTFSSVTLDTQCFHRQSHHLLDS